MKAKEVNNILSATSVALISFLSACLLINKLVYGNFKLVNANLKEFDETIGLVKRIKEHLKR